MNFVIAIPVYNNVNLLENCLSSLLYQTNNNFDLYIFDDSSTEDYKYLLKSYANLSIIYIRNETNLGALKNMQNAYNFLKDKYDFIMIMHEDDMLHTNFVNTVHKSIVSVFQPAIIISKFVEFNSSIECISHNSISSLNFSFVKKKMLAFLFLQNNPLAFGSVVYNTRIYKDMFMDFESYAEFADRPFLLNALTDDNLIIVFNDPLYFYRSHGKDDNRWKYLRSFNIFNLLNLYKLILVKSGYISNNKFKIYSTSFVFDSYKNLKLSKNDTIFTSYLIKAVKIGFISFKYALLRLNFINKFGTILKRNIF